MSGAKKLTPAQREQKRAARAQRRREEQEQRRQHGIEYTCLLHPEMVVLTYPELLVYSSDFVRSIGEQFRSKGSLTARQIETVGPALDAEHRRLALHFERERAVERGEHVPFTRRRDIEVTGTVTATWTNLPGPFQETRWPPKMSVRPDEASWEIELTIPKSLEHAAPGARITVHLSRAGVTRDPARAWGSNPRQGVVLD